MAGCSAITQAGSRCQAIAITNEDWCNAHHPSRAEARRKSATKAGKRGGRGRTGPSDLRDAQGQIRGVIAAVLAGKIKPNVGAVAFQGFNCLLRAIEGETKIREAVDLEERMERLEDASRNRERGSAWGG